MADQWYGGQPNSDGGSERWNVNMPAVVGVVFAFLVGVVIWVVMTSGGDDPEAIQSIDSGASTVPTLPPVATPAPSTTPQPMPVTTPAAPISTLPATTPPTAPPATQPPPAPPTNAPPPPPPPTTATTTTAAAPTTTTSTTLGPTTTRPSGDGDLGVPGRPISRPPCDGGYITVVASAVGNDASAAGVEGVLDRYDGSSYLRTDLTCPSLTQAVDGQPIYVVYFGPFANDGAACAAIDDGPDGSYVRRLSNDLDPTHSVVCD